MQSRKIPEGWNVGRQAMNGAGMCKMIGRGDKALPPRSQSITEPSATALQQTQPCLPALWVQGWVGGRQRATQSRHPEGR